MKADMVIVGQGIAGTVLAHECLRRGLRVVIIDQPQLSTCSAVAAGIWNPVVFKRLTKSWMADDVLPVMLSFYEDCARRLQTELFTTRAIIKPFSEANEATFWQRKALDGNEYLDSTVYHGLELSAADKVETYSKVNHSGNLHVPMFLHESRLYFGREAVVLEEAFDFELLQVSDCYITYKHIEAGQIVFCEGHLLHKNPFFNYIPLKPAKGEVLTIRCEGLNLQRDIFNKNLFILPLGDQLYKVGATYEWTELNDLPTERGYAELIGKLKALLHVPFEVIHHQAGVRPSVIDRRPVLGRHPQHPALALFNGFGTKGVMLSPYFAQRFCDFLFSKTPLPIETALSRFPYHS